MSVRLLVAALAGSLAAYGQTATATIQGVVRDPSGAAIPEAAVTVRNSQTGVRNEVRTTALGRYVVPFLQTGDYEVAVEKTGFRRYATSGIKLDVQQNLTLDVALVVGDLATAVQVSAAPPPLSTATSTVATTIGNKAVVDIPLNGRTVLTLALNTPGVLKTGGSGGAASGTGGPTMYSPIIGGGRGMTSEVTVDGSPLSVADPTGGARAFGGRPPSVDAVEEFTVQVNALSAEYGRSGGGAINVATRQGTNKLHGTMREFLRNSVFDANGFFNNLAGRPLASFKRNQYGFSVGGPVYLGKSYDGRNRTFFFLDWERENQRSPSSFTGTMPIDAWKQGNFSQLKEASGRAVIIADPTTIKPDGKGSYIRDPFPGNLIPLARFDKASRNIMQYYPQPNQPSTNSFTPANNYYQVATAGTDTDNFTLRLDDIVTQKWRTYVRLNRSNTRQLPQIYYGNIAESQNTYTLTRPQIAGVWDNTWTLNPTTVLDLRLGVSRFHHDRTMWAKDFNPTELGIAPYFYQEIVASGEPSSFPSIGMTGISTLGGGAALSWVPTTYIVSGSVTKVLGRHTLKAGAEYRKFYLNFWQCNERPGVFSFAPSYTQVNPYRAASTDGFPFAAFLLGTVSGYVNHAPVQALASSYWGGYLQDDFRVSRRLTINIGLRYELDTPRTERYNRLSYFDLNTPSPIAGKVPQYPNLVGAMRFAGPDGRQQSPTDYNNFGPRIGFAWQLDPKTVMRGGYGLMYDASPMQVAYHNGGFQGIRTTTNVITSIDGLLPYSSMSDPFPRGFKLALGATPGPTSGVNTDLGSSIGDSFIPEYVSPVIQQWNLNLQRSLPGGIVVETGYTASKGQHLQMGESVNLNQLPPQYLALGTKLTEIVPNPFHGVITDPLSSLSLPTTSRAGTLRPYPQYTGITPQWQAWGNSLWHAFTLRIEKRFAKGIGFLVAYTGSKLISDSEGQAYFSAVATYSQDFYNRKADRAISANDVASRLTASLNYDLPFGRGRHFLGSAHHAVDLFLGGWQFNGVLTLQGGQPIAVTQGPNNLGLGSSIQRPTSTGKTANISGSRTKHDERLKWFDPAQFTVTPPYTFGNVGRTLPDVRTPGIRNLDLSIFKHFRVKGDRVALQLRGEAFNAFNTTQFGRPGAGIDSATAGTITGTGVSARQIQIAMKLLF